MRTRLTANTGVNSYNININNISISTYFTCEVEESDTYTIFVARRDIIGNCLIVGFKNEFTTFTS